MLLIILQLIEEDIRNGKSSPLPTMDGKCKCQNINKYIDIVVICFVFFLLKLEPYMTESFILSAFRKMGETPLNVKVMRNKFTGEPAGYCFVHFANDEEAIDAMHKLNSKPIPGTNPVVRFRLNNASNNANRQFVDREFSVWVGDLSPDVDDYNLYRVFSSKYNTIKTAKGRLVFFINPSGP